jgi:hypothetical protein
MKKISCQLMIEVPMIEPTRKVEFILKDTNESSIEPILKYFDNPPDSDHLQITLHGNTGGNLVPVLELIERIRHSDINVSICVKDYVFSAAAVLYFLLLFEKDCSNFTNVQFNPLEKPILVLFHKPRNVEGEFIRFPDSEKLIKKSAIPLDIEGQSLIVERIFHKFLKATGNNEIKEVPRGGDFIGMKHKNQHILDSWENNYDCIFPWAGMTKLQE